VDGRTAAPGFMVTPFGIQQTTSPAETRDTTPCEVGHEHNQSTETGGGWSETINVETPVDSGSAEGSPSTEQSVDDATLADSTSRQEEGTQGGKGLLFSAQHALLSGDNEENSVEGIHPVEDASERVANDDNMFIGMNEPLPSHSVVDGEAEWFVALWRCWCFD